MNKSVYSSEEPVITVIIAVYNAESTLQQAIESVLSQVYTNIELIIIDGGSKDKTVAIIEKYTDRIHYWISEKDKGVYDAWNKGLEKANGDWITFLGADDFFWNNHVLKTVVPEMQRAISQGIRYIYGKVNLLSESGTVINTLGQSWEESKKLMMHRMSVVHCASFHHKSLFSEHGQFNTQFKIAGDYEFLLREFVKGRDALFVNYVIAGMRVGGLSANIRLRLTVAREDIYARKLNQLKPTFSHRAQVVKAQLSIALLKILGPSAVNIISDLLRIVKGKKTMWSKVND